MVSTAARQRDADRWMRSHGVTLRSHRGGRVESSSEGADVDRPPVNEFRVHRPGAVSAFFVYQAGFVAAGFWTWLVLATIRGGGAAHWETVAATGAGTVTMVGVLLGTRYFLQRN